MYIWHVYMWEAHHGTLGGQGQHCGSVPSFPLYMASEDGAQSVGLQWQVLLLLIHFLSLKTNTYLAMLLEFNSIFSPLS